MLSVISIDVMLVAVEIYFAMHREPTDLIAAHRIFLTSYFSASIAVRLGCALCHRWQHQRISENDLLYARKSLNEALGQPLTRRRFEEYLHRQWSAQAWLLFEEIANFKTQFPSTQKTLSLVNEALNPSESKQ